MKIFKLNKFLAASFVVVLSLTSVSADAYNLGGILNSVKNAARDNQSFSVPAKGHLEVAFSPKEGSQNLVIKVIDSAAKTRGGEILMLTYSFTSAPVTDALLRAIHQGVKVSIVADYKHNVAQDRSGKAAAALSALKTAGADVRVIRVYPIHHDKVLIANRQTVQLGSFNYSAAAAEHNSENVLVNWDNPELAAVYVKHFERNYNQSEPYNSKY